MGPLTLGLAGAPSSPQMVNAAFPTDSLPATLSVGTVDLTVGSLVSGIVEPVYWLPDTGSVFLKTGSTYLSIEFSAKNTDITADQSLGFHAALIDDAGRIYYSTGLGTEKQTCSLQQKIGPGQALHGTLCFTLPGSYAVKKGGLALSITGPGTDKTYTVKPVQFDNCAASQTLPQEEGFNGYIHPVTSEQTFTIPGQITGHLKQEEEHRLRFDGMEGETIDITIDPVIKSWILQLFDPSGRNVFNTYFPRSIDNGPALTNIPLLCGGTYSLYISPATDSSYTVTVSLK
ncbi:MAG: hypothetical protein LC793_05700 [Thermomicrobia bacterium]|nr:hypothetical protein [Thermomicrobia bacterium]